MTQGKTQGNKQPLIRWCSMNSWNCAKRPEFINLSFPSLITIFLSIFFDKKKLEVLKLAQVLELYNVDEVSWNSASVAL